MEWNTSTLGRASETVDVTTRPGNLGFLLVLFDWVEPVVTALALAFYGAIVPLSAGCSAGRGLIRPGDG
jgi:hypothetical protein